jgi:hypothetical protein
MTTTYYLAACADGKTVAACPHEHQTVHSATACISSAGGYVVAVEEGQMRALTDVEESEFQEAIRGQRARSGPYADCDYLFRASRGFVRPT